MDTTTPTPLYSVAAALDAFRRIPEGHTHLCDIRIAASVLDLRPNASQTQFWFDLEDGSGRMPAKTLNADLRPLLEHSKRTGARLRLKGSIRAGVCRKDEPGIEVRAAEYGDGRSDHGQLLTLVRTGTLSRTSPRALPHRPEGIAIVAPFGSQALEDIIAVLEEGGSAAVQHILQILMRGHHAAARIAEALGEASGRAPLSLTLLVRGGGSAGDFTPFDDLDVARAILDHPVPVITGIGHARDRTLADAVADLACHSPGLAAHAACFGRTLAPSGGQPIDLAIGHRVENSSEFLRRLVSDQYPGRNERGEWLTTPDPVLGGRAPWQVIADGEVDTLAAFLATQSAGSSA